MAQAKQTTITITINAQQAERVLEKMRSMAADLNDEYKALKETGQGNSAAAKQLLAQINALNQAEAKNVTAAERVEKAMQNLATTSTRNLRRALSDGRKWLDKMFEGDPRREQLVEELARIREQMDKNTGAMRKQVSEIELVDKAYKDLANTSTQDLRTAAKAAETALEKMGANTPGLDELKTKLAVIKEQINKNLTGHFSPVNKEEEITKAAAAPSAYNTQALKEIQGWGREMMQEIPASPKLDELKEKLRLIGEQIKENERIAEPTASLVNRVDAAVGDLAGKTNGELRSALEAGKKAMEGMASGPQLEEMKRKLQQIEQQLKRNESVTRDIPGTFKRVKDVVDNLRSTSLRDLRQALIEGKQAMEQMTDPKQLHVMREYLQKIQRQIEKNTGAASKSTRLWNNALQNIVNYTGLFAAFSTLKGYIEDSVRSLVKMSDQMADIRKVSGLTTENIKDLSKELAKIDSRTSQGDMLKIAYEGAKLGMGEYGTEGLVGFTKAANQVNVALKEDLGDEALTALSKFTENMGLIKKYGVEQAMLKAGSAMFQLSATSTATSANIVEFTKRMMAAGRVAGLTADQILALGSAADSMNLMPEVASTAMSRFVGALQVNHNLIESALHIEPGTINHLFSAGKMMDAMLLVMEKMQGKNMNQLDFIWKDLGSDGTRLKNVITSMVNQLPMLRKNLQTANTAFEQGVAVTNEYNIQQQTAAALIERAGNMWQKAFVNSDNVDVVHEMAQAWYDVSLSITQANSNILAIRVGFEMLKYAIMGVVQLIPVLINLMYGVMLVFGGTGLVKAVQGAWYVLTHLLTVIRALRIAFAGLSAAAKLTWWGVAAGVILQVASMIWGAKKASDAAAESFAKLKRRQDDLIGSMAVEQKRLDNLYTSIKNANKGTKERARLIDVFNKQYGQYLKNMLTEKSSLGEIRKAYEQVNKAIIGKLALEAKQADYQREVTPRVRWEAQKQHNADVLLQKSSFGISGSQLETELKNRVDSGKMTKQQFLAWLFGAGGYASSYGKQNKAATEGKIYGKEEIIKSGFDPKASQQVRDDAAAQAVASYVWQYGAANKKIKDIDKIYAKWAEVIKLAEGDGGYLGSLDTQQTDKASLAAQKKEEREKKEAKRKELDQAEKDSTAIISTIEEYYKLQEQGIEQMVADGNLVRWQADTFIKENKRRMNIALQQARLSLSGAPNDFEKLRKEGMGIGQDLVNYSEVSLNALNKIRQIDMEAARAVLAKFKGDKDADSSALLDKIRKNAAQNILAATRIVAEQREAVQAIIRQDDYMKQSAENSNKSYADLGLLRSREQFMAENDAQHAKTYDEKSSAIDGNNLSEVSSVAPFSMGKALDVMRAQFRSNPKQNYGYNVLSDRMITRTLDDGTTETTNEGREEATRFWNDFKNGGYTDAQKKRHTAQEWLPALDVKEIDSDPEKQRALYLQLSKDDDQYYEDQRKTYDHDKKQVDERWSRSRRGEYYDEAEHYAQREMQVRQMNGTTSTAMQDMGLDTNILDNDPEIAMYELRMQKATEYYEFVKQQSNDQKLIREAEQAQEQSVLEMSSQIADKLKARMDNLQQTLDPLKEFSTQVGEAFVEMADDAKSGRDAIRNAAVAMVKSYAQMTLKMIAQQITQRIQRALFHKQMEKMEAKHNKAMSKSAESSQADQLDVTKTAQEGITDIMKTEGKKASDTKKEQAGEDAQTTAQETQGNAFAGIASGASKIIGKLGWWGIPLVAVITALLQGLLNKALSKLGGKSSSENANVNTKLVTGMLTYDSGNVRQFSGAVDGKSFPVVGSDGKVYAVSDAAQLETGLITKPLLTTVGGQPSLVAERGPEMVIGRETTAAMMMSRPDLIREIVRFDRTRSGATFRAYDAGNVQQVGEASPPLATGAAIDGETLAALQQLAPALAMLTERLSRPISASVNMYGRDGLYESFGRAQQFMKSKG